MAAMFEQLLSLRAERLDEFEGGTQIVHVQIEVDGRPMALELALIGCTRRGLPLPHRRHAQRRRW